jgi:hypothetical protein
VGGPLAILAYEAVCSAIVAGAMHFAPGGDETSLVPPVLGGLLVGASQAMSLLLTSRPLGGEYSSSQQANNY